jgi:ubiquitin carboxyl-terminal hydrolase 22/27/51
MAGKSQQDAQEYYMMLVDKLHESTAVVSDWKGRCQCFFHKAFFGRMRSEVTCDGCGTISRTQDAFSVISLDFQKQAKRRKKFAALQSTSAVPDLYGALQAYTSAETLLAEDYTCQGCVTPNSASKRLRIRKLPALLCIQVKRFGARTSGGSYVEEKHEGRIDFPLMLNMRPFTARVKGQEEERLVYDLESVVVHVGQQIQNGHYLAFCRQDDTWFRFDDEMVSKSTAAEVLAQEAYLLFYSLRSWTPAGIRPPQNGVR